MFDVSGVFHPYRLNLDFQNLISAIVHLLLSISYVVLSSNSNQLQRLLSPIFQILENLLPIATNYKISHTAMMEIIHFQDKGKLISEEQQITSFTF